VDLPKATFYPREAVSVDPRVVGDIAAEVKKTHCVLFLGAGIHAPPPEGSPFSYPEAQRPASASSLSTHLAGNCNFATRLPKEDPQNLQRVTLCYEDEKSRARLVEEIRKAVQVDKKPSPILLALAELDFPLVITTNYDRLFENALAAAGKQPLVSVYTPNLEPTVDYDDPTPESPMIFKIHGDISRPETIVVTDEDYIQFVLRMGNKEVYDPVPETVRYYLKKRSTLFVGYSLLDYNLRLLFKTLRWRADPANWPEMYSVDYAPDPLILAFWHDKQRVVNFVAEDVWAFVPELYELVKGEKLEPGEELTS
jgi:hypothetical protein